MNIKPRLNVIHWRIILYVVCLWAGALFVWLGRYPNQLTAMVFDRWKIILPFISIMIIAFALCRKYHLRGITMSLIIVCVLFTIFILNFSMWMPILIQNNTAKELTAVMKDLSNDRIREVSVPPGRTKWIEILAAGDDTFGDIQWHLLVYDEAGAVYLQQVIKGSEIERGHTIQINP